MIRTNFAVAIVIALAVGFSDARAAVHPGSEAFVERAVSEFGLDADEVAALLARAEYKQSIVDAMTRPAESKPWHEYRPIFLNERRIKEGIVFWRENRALVDSVSEQFGVDPQIIVSIIGVETLYGRITGSYRVIDALATLGFYYPKELSRDRSEFFSTELMHFIKLAQEENLPLDQVTGSYAGAMGMGQFIPSSYRAYAVDFDGNGHRDLWRSTADVVGSVANYLHQHGWRPGDPVVNRARPLPAAEPELASRRDFKPKLNVGQLAEKGYHGSADLDPERKAAVLKLDEGSHQSYWLTFDNFYVITRYNRSPLYAMAVLQLSEAILEGM
ncbi:MAG: lytic murein transglycosylase B [Xanthomonadales bacterium]|nr:lytic murein transglycosylase B [Gammaproteobacteria bacterium]NNL96366.1 lytic murein transglycosylase B [Xanthomonadales bacterium]